MKTTRLMLLLASLCMAMLASAEPARPRKASTTTPPAAAATVRGPNQPAARVPAARGGAQLSLQVGRTAPAMPLRGAPTALGGPGHAPPTASKLPTAGEPGRGKPAPKSPAANDNDRREPRSGYAPPPPASHGPGQPPAHDGWGRPDEPRGPQRVYGPPKPQPAPHRPYDWDQPYRGSYNGRWRYAPLLMAIVRAFLPSDPKVLGAAIVASDDTFLGIISRDTTDPDSVTNGWGRFGSPLSPHSIWNPDGRWGSRCAPYSPWNPYATRPPKVFDGNEFRGYLSANTNLHPRVDPDWLRTYLNLPRW